MVDAALFSSAKTDYGTPQHLYDALHEVFWFGLDAAANAENAKCENFLTEGMDGLSVHWSHMQNGMADEPQPHYYADDVATFCNPPYGRTITPKWVRHGYEVAKCCGTVVMLLPARTDTKWFHKYIYRKATVLFLEGRLKFEPSNSAAPFPSMIVAWGEDVYDQLNTFEHLWEKVNVKS